MTRQLTHGRVDAPPMPTESAQVQLPDPPEMVPVTIAFDSSPSPGVEYWLHWVWDMGETHLNVGTNLTNTVSVELGQLESDPSQALVVTPRWTNWAQIHVLVSDDMTNWATNGMSWTDPLVDDRGYWRLAIARQRQLLLQ